MSIFSFKTTKELEFNKLNNNQQIEKKKFINTTFISKYNNWSPLYTEQVQFEYERFLELRNIDDKLSPSDIIDKFWHTHILDTKLYYNYCVNKFFRIIHHDPNDSLNQQARKIRFCSTLIKYKEKYGLPIYNDIWKNTNFKNINNIDDNNENDENNENNENDLKPQLKIPNYKDHITTSINIVKIFIFYTFDDGYSKPIELEKIIFKKWHPNNLPLDSTIITINVNEFTTINDLKTYIFNKIKLKNIDIKIYPHPTWKKMLNAKNKIEKRINHTIKITNPNTILSNNCDSNYLDLNNFDIKNEQFTENKIFKKEDNTFKFYIAELVEMTYNGYC